MVVSDSEVSSGSRMKTEKHDLLTVAEVARILRVDETTIRRWIKYEQIEAVALPIGPSGRRGHRIRRSTLNDILGDK